VTIAVAGVSLAVAGWLWFARFREGAAARTHFTAVPLTAYPGWELSPSFSPDGRQVVFVSDAAADAAADAGKIYSTRNTDIYIKQIGVEEPFRLTDHPAPDLSPAWSPDGQTIAFARQLSPERVAYIVKPQRGGPERTVAEFTRPKGAIRTALLDWISPSCTWTADSQGLVVVGMNADGSVCSFVLSFRVRKNSS
jgi:Tol biopolymer transport system component